MKDRSSKSALLLVVAILFVAVGCAAHLGRSATMPSPSAPAVMDETLPVLADDMEMEALVRAIDGSLAYYERLPEGTLLNLGERQVTVRQMRETLTTFRQIVTSDAPGPKRLEMIRTGFSLHRAAPSVKILLTGYYEPDIEAAPTPSEKYRYPIYGVPDDLVTIPKERGKVVTGRWSDGKLVPYYSRADIEERGVLAGRNLEIAWLADPVDRFYLHIQGSGRLRFPDGTCVRVGFARSNGRPYQSIAAWLLKTGRIGAGQATHEEVKRYLRTLPPAELQSVLSQNECYVFFCFTPSGPRGALGVTVVPGRTVAIDPDVYPKGGIALLRARKPVFGGQTGEPAWEPFSRFVLAQDVGVAIKGPDRIDLFCGSGEEAERLAGRFKQEGEIWFFLKK